MAPGIGGDVGGDAVNPLERIERKPRGAGARVWGCFQGQVAVLQFLQCVHGHGRTRDIAGLRLEGGQGGGIDGGSGKDREARVHPREEIVHKALGETFGLVQALEQQAAEHFHDCGGIERGKRQKSDARPVIADAAMAEEPLFVNSDLSLEGLAPGSYMLEIIAAESSAHAIAKQLVPFRIAAK
jgi:hypothetical protein